VCVVVLGWMLVCIDLRSCKLLHIFSLSAQRAAVKPWIGGGDEKEDYYKTPIYV